MRTLRLFFRLLLAGLVDCMLVGFDSKAVVGGCQNIDIVVHKHRNNSRQHSQQCSGSQRWWPQRSQHRGYQQIRPNKRSLRHRNIFQCFRPHRKHWKRRRYSYQSKSLHSSTLQRLQYKNLSKRFLCHKHCRNTAIEPTLVKENI